MWLWIVISILMLWGILTYNLLVKHKNLVKEAWSGIDVQLTLRADLLPPLVECVKAYKNFEQSVLTEVTSLRSQSQENPDQSKRQSIENQISSHLGKIFMLAENYPELKAGQNFQQLQQELVQIEDQIQYARRYFNGAVRDYNTTIQKFPSLVIAKIFGYREKEFFEVVSLAERKNVQVQM